MTAVLKQQLVSSSYCPTEDLKEFRRCGRLMEILKFQPAWSRPGGRVAWQLKLRV